MTDHVGALGRGGVVFAMSSGLVATMGLPAQAVAQTSREANAPQGAAPAAAQASFENSFQALSPNLLSGAPVVAPVAGQVTWEHSSFTAVPKHAVPAPHAVAKGSVSQSTGSVSFGPAPNLPASSASIISLASRYIGVPYRYGGTTPAGFDCSGYVQYVFKHLGISLPRTADQQYRATRRITRSQAKAGDLVFFLSGGYAYHVGIYAGNGMIYEAPRPGLSVHLVPIWSSSVAFGRVLN